MSAAKRDEITTANAEPNLVVHHAKDKPHARIYHEVIEARQLSLQALGLFVVLSKYAGSRGYCFPSLTTLAKDGGTSESRVRKLLRELEESGALVIEKVPGRASKYHLGKSLTPPQNEYPSSKQYPPQNEYHTPPQNEQGPLPEIVRGPPLKPVPEEVLIRNINEEISMKKEESREPDAATRTIPTPRFQKPVDEQDLYAQGALIGVSKLECDKFFLYYEERRWEGVQEWRLRLRAWKLNSKNFANTGSGTGSRPSSGGAFR